MAEDPTSPKASDSSEDTRRYWEHLDAKFASFGAPAQPAAVRADEPVAAVTPEPEPTAVPASVPVPVSERPGSGLIAEAFAELLALEDGEPGARAVRLTFGEETAPAAVEPTLSDGMIEDVVRRVIERMAPDLVRAVVADIVSETAERLVKEEIDRIRKQHV